MDELRAKAEAGDFAQNEAETQGNSSEGETVKPQNSQTGQSGKPAQSQPVSKYVSEAKVKENILGDLQYSKEPEKLIFHSIELDESQEPAIYLVEVETADLYRKLFYQINAQTGLIRDRIFYNADNFEEEGQIGLHKEGGDSSEPEPWNKYWELYCRPTGQKYYDDIPIIRFDSEEGRAYLEVQEQARLEALEQETEG